MRKTMLNLRTPCQGTLATTTTLHANRRTKASVGSICISSAIFGVAYWQIASRIFLVS